MHNLKIEYLPIGKPRAAYILTLLVCHWELSFDANRLHFSRGQHKHLHCKQRDEITTERRKRYPFAGFEPRTFCLPGRRTTIVPKMISPIHFTVVEEYDERNSCIILYMNTNLFSDFVLQYTIIAVKSVRMLTNYWYTVFVILLLFVL